MRHQHGIPISTSFEYYYSSSLGAYNTSAFTYWTDRVAPDPANPGRVLPFQMIDGNDVNQVFGVGSPEASESASDRTNDFVGIAVPSADQTCSTVGNGSVAHAKPELGGQGVAALYGHKYVASQVSPITQTDDTPITGFNQANTFNPTSRYTLGYLTALLRANVQVVYGYIADAHDSRNSCAPTSPSKPVVADTNNGRPCGAFAPGEAGYVQQLLDWDLGFEQFFQGINSSNTVFVFHADEKRPLRGRRAPQPRL